MAGILYGVGVGPGDPELMTLKAVRVLKSCPILAAPSSRGKPGVAYEIACAAVPELREKECVILELPMMRSGEELVESREKAAGQLLRQLRCGNDVAVLTLGDPSVYSTYCYLQELVCDAGFTARMIAGVPSFCAAAACVGQSLTQADEPLRILPGSYSCVEKELSGGGTKILMKTGKQLPKVKELLQERELLQKSVLVENCGMQGEYARPLEQVQEAGYFSIIIVK